jgi:23S rRNA (guanine2445-N2)-methyltransferase / 23S rRNA (guanine2069-N7)-methyltransferase
MSSFFAVAPRGTERVLSDELHAHGIVAVEEQRGGVTFGRQLEDAYRACLWSRVASRVLFPLDSFEAPDAAALYEGVRMIDWVQHLGPDNTLAVDVSGKNAPAGPGHFLALKTKDAIVDRIRESEGARPSIDTAHPDVRINVYVNRSRVTINVDLFGRGLHRRGIDRAGMDAPLKENLAAAILRLAGWPEKDASFPFFDPMCGSGTLLLEAAWMALDVAPGSHRRDLATTGWRGHDQALWTRLLDEADERTQSAVGRTLHIFGADSSSAAVAVARENLRRAGLISRVRVEQRDLKTTDPPSTTPGLLVTNPPYGARLGESDKLRPLYELLGDVLKRRFSGWSAWVFTGNSELGKRIGLRPVARHVLFNGPIESRLLEIPISVVPVAASGGPGWRRRSPESKALVTRLKKNLKRLRPWAAREQVVSYRIYDADVPEYNVAIDWYDGVVRIDEYIRPRKVPIADAERRLRDARLVVSDILDVNPESVVLGGRRRLVGDELRPRVDDQPAILTMREGDLRFEVILADHLDTGLCLDDRLLRRNLLAQSVDRDVLNLFADTCTASVAAAVGGARSTTSIDPSAASLAWGHRNVALNEVECDRHRLVEADVTWWLSHNGHQRYDLVLLVAPTDASLKATRTDVDIQRDHVRLLEHIGRVLKPAGEVLLVTHARDFTLDADRLKDFRIQAITGDITSLDFERRPQMRAWSLFRAASEQNQSYKEALSRGKRPRWSKN